MQGIIDDPTFLNNFARCLSEGNVYCFTGVGVTPLGPGYYIANTKYQLLFSKDTRIVDTMNDCDHIPKRKYNLTKLSNITSKMQGTQQLIGMLFNIIDNCTIYCHCISFKYECADIVCLVVSVGPCHYPKNADPNREIIVIDKT